MGLDRCLKEGRVVNLETLAIPNPRNDIIIPFRFHVIQHEV